MDGIYIERHIIPLVGMIGFFVTAIIMIIKFNFNNDDSKKKAESLNEKPNNDKQSDRENIAFVRERIMNYENTKVIEELKKEIEKLKNEKTADNVSELREDMEALKRENEQLKRDNEEYKAQYEKELNDKRAEYKKKLAMLDELYTSKIGYDKHNDDN